MKHEDRCSTGIKELDEMLLGGLPRGRTVLVEGLPGTGKTILSLHFILAGLFEDPNNPEPAIYVCLDESPSDLMKEAYEFGWKLQPLMDINKLVLIDAFSARLGLTPELPRAIPMGKFNVDSVMQRIKKVTDEVNAQRLVIDPVSALLDEMEGKERRDAVLSLTAVLKKLSLTTLITSELKQAGVGVERYAAHGVIRLAYDEKEKTVGRRLRIMKMRETMHSMDVIPYDITGDGIKLRV